MKVDIIAKHLFYVFQSESDLVVLVWLLMKTGTTITIFTFISFHCLFLFLCYIL